MHVAGDDCAEVLSQGGPEKQWRVELWYGDVRDMVTWKEAVASTFPTTGTLHHHWSLDFYLCVFFAGSAYEVCHKSLYMITLYCCYIAALGDLVPAFLLFLFYCFPLDAICIYFLKAVCQIYIKSFEVDGSAIVHYYHICSINYVEPFWMYI